jgi:hypothetical protein
MIRLRLILTIVAIVMVIGWLIVTTDTEADKNVADLFEIKWRRTEYDNSVKRYNPNVSSNQQPSRANQNLRLSCEITIKDPNLVLGISRQGNLTEMIDSEGQNIEIGQEIPRLSRSPTPGMRNMPKPGSFSIRYEGLRYRQRMTQPPKIPRWQTFLYKYLKYVGIKPKPFKRELVNELQPARVRFDLDLGSLECSSGEFRSLNGYYYVLMAESVENIEVPFEPNDQWVNLTDELAIQVREAKWTIYGTRIRYNFDIEENRLGGGRFNRLSFGDYLPEKIVMGRQLIGEDGKPLRQPMGFGSLRAHVGGSGSGSHSSRSGASPIKKIQFVIAVNPKHYKIPFELKNVPLPNQYGGGTGESNNPYQIATAEDLMLLGESPEDYDKHFILTADIDLEPNLPGRKVFDKAVIAPDTDTTESNFQGTAFTGIFDGNGHRILNLTITGGDYLGLFGQNAQAEVRDLGLMDVNIAGSGHSIGGLVGYNLSDVTQCFSTGTVNGNTSVGGLIGINSNSSAKTQEKTVIKDCYSTANSTGQNRVGGLVGYRLGGRIVNCYAVGKVMGDVRTGGLLGISTGGSYDIFSSFWDIETSGFEGYSVGKGKTTTEMQTTGTFLEAGWDFVDETENGTEDIWWILQGQDYPRLWWELIPEN